MPPNSQDTEYIHGASATEQCRLDLMNGFINEAFVTNLVEVLRGARDTVVGHGFSDPEYCDVAPVTLVEWAKRLDAALWYGINWAEGTRP